MRTPFSNFPALIGSELDPREYSLFYTNRKEIWPPTRLHLPYLVTKESSNLLEQAYKAMSSFNSNQHKIGNWTGTVRSPLRKVKTTASWTYSIFVWLLTAETDESGYFTPIKSQWPLLVYPCQSFKRQGQSSMAPLSVIWPPLFITSCGRQFQARHSHLWQNSTKCNRLVGFFKQSTRIPLVWLWNNIRATRNSLR